MHSLFFRNLFFTLLQPGLVAGVAPWLILRAYCPEIPGHWHISQFIGAALFLTGAGITLDCIVRFGREGHGTLSPADPTRALVVRGLYRYIRNPMYVGVLCLLAGESLYFQCLALGWYTGGIFLLFHLFIVWREEPRLRRDFGEAYNVYCKKVKRWGV